MNEEQIHQELQLNLNNQIEGSMEQKLHQVVDFLYGGAYDEMHDALSEEQAP